MSYEQHDCPNCGPGAIFGWSKQGHVCLKCGHLHKRAHKFHAKPTMSHGIRFASRREANRYANLLLLLRSGYIEGPVRCQTKWPLKVNDVQIGFYVSDFDYTLIGGAKIVEDAKGVRTPLYRWKRKHFEAQYAPLTITEV